MEYSGSQCTKLQSHYFHVSESDISLSQRISMKRNDMMNWWTTLTIDKKATKLRAWSSMLHKNNNKNCIETTWKTRRFFYVERDKKVSFVQIDKMNLRQTVYNVLSLSLWIHRTLTENDFLVKWEYNLHSDRIVAQPTLSSFDRIWTVWFLFINILLKAKLHCYNK